MNLFQLNNVETNYRMVTLLRCLNNDISKGNVFILVFSVYSPVNKKVLLCKWVLESETRNVSILIKPS